MTTLRRDIIQKVQSVLEANLESFESEFTLEEISTYVADKILELRAFKPFDNIASDPMWDLLHGKDVSQAQLDSLNVEKTALNAFESALQIPANINWYPARSSEEKIWKELREFITAKYKEDKDSFTHYQTWRNQPFVRGAMSNVQIKSNPENFMSSWSDFRRAVPLVVKREVTTDSNDIPRSY